MIPNAKRIWVYPEFQRRLKIKASEENTSIYDLTKKMCDDFDQTFTKIPERPMEAQRERYKFKI